MSLKHEFKNGWNVIREMNNMDNVMGYSKEYLDFLNKGKTERLCAREVIKLAKEQGFISFEEASKNNIKCGDKIFAENRDKGVALFVIGEKDIEQGMKIIASHIDSPRLDLKQNPLYEDSNMAYFKTHYYGGIRKYQWVTIPLALYGVVFLHDGTKVDISIGDEENDPVFCINDLLPHLSADQNQKKLAEGIAGEDLNVLIGSIPCEDEEEQSVKYNLLKLLNEKYNLTEEDFLSAELEIVPAGKARDLGLDKSMVMAYGQDDRVCAFAAVKAIFEIEKPEYTVVTLCVDKEETGSYGNTGMHSRFFENTVAELINLQVDYSDLKIKRALANSKVLSGDVNVAYDPNFASVYEKNNSAYAGKGVVLMKYSGSRGKSSTSDANAEFVSEVRRIFNQENVVWQTGELGKVDQGGGGTVAYILANYGAEVIDCGVGVLSMHAPYEVVSKADIFEMYRGYKAFFNINL
ncbi:MAG: aminopeptidase [Terrisporobacter sp.]|uniref:aminopeptidase n=1 Tax=Terrisporobacter sp. TaxID=1965305 RepID=UPI002FCC1920